MSRAIAQPQIQVRLLVKKKSSRNVSLFCHYCDRSSELFSKCQVVRRLLSCQLAKRARTLSVGGVKSDGSQIATPASHERASFMAPQGPSPPLSLSEPLLPFLAHLPCLPSSPCCSSPVRHTIHAGLTLPVRHTDFSPSHVRHHRCLHSHSFSTVDTEVETEWSLLDICYLSSLAG